MNTLICIGAGPTNLSLACLILGHADVVILEKRKTVAWHPGLLMDDSDLQVSHFKDLVTLADPTSPFTFINFLFDIGRIFHFFNAQFSAIPRQEFSQYLEWVASKIACVAFDQPVESIAVDGGAFHVTTATARYSTTHISVGIGQTLRIPVVFREVVQKAHAVEYLGAKKRLMPEM